MHLHLDDPRWPQYLTEMMQARVACCVSRILGYVCKTPYLVGINLTCPTCGSKLGGR